VFESENQEFSTNIANLKKILRTALRNFSRDRSGDLAVTALLERQLETYAHSSLHFKMQFETAQFSLTSRGKF
jgi:hypothetical protein